MYYDLHIFICTNERPEGHERGSCARRGAIALRQYFKTRLKKMGLANSTRVNSAGCLDRCELGPVCVIYPDGIWYHIRDTKDIDEIIQAHFVDDQIVERLRITDDQLTELRPEQVKN